VISLLQHDNEQAAEQILARWLPATLARVAVRHMQNFAVALATTKLVVPQRHYPMTAFDMASETVDMRGRALLH
jgi:hypothetical protein